MKHETSSKQCGNLEKRLIRLTEDVDRLLSWNLKCNGTYWAKMICAWAAPPFRREFTLHQMWAAKVTYRQAWDTLRWRETEARLLVRGKQIWRQTASNLTFLARLQACVIIKVENKTSCELTEKKRTDQISTQTAYSTLSEEQREAASEWRFEKLQPPPRAAPASCWGKKKNTPSLTVTSLFSFYVRLWNCEPFAIKRHWTLAWDWREVNRDLKVKQQQPTNLSDTHLDLLIAQAAYLKRVNNTQGWRPFAKRNKR